MRRMTRIAAVLLFVGGSALVASAQNVQEGLVAYWPLNESDGDTAADATGNGHDGTLMGDPEWTGGHFAGGLAFDGVEDEVVVPYDALLNPETFTVTAWANVEAGSAGAHRAVLASRDDFPQRGYIFYAEPGDTWQYWTGVGGGWNVVQGPAVESGDWAHLAGVFADDSQRFYYNGELAAESNAAVSINEAQNFLIGASANELDPHMFFFVGIIDDVRLYDRELSVDDIDAVMDGEIAAVDVAGKLTTTWGALKGN
jgi:hypothetical protein